MIVIAAAFCSMLPTCYKIPGKHVFRYIFIAFSLYESSGMINCNHYELKMSGKTEMGESFARRTHRSKEIDQRELMIYKKRTDSEKGVELKKLWLLFNPFLERPEEKIRRSNKSSVKLTVPGFVGSVQSKKLSRPSPPWTPKPAPDLSNAKWVRKQVDKTD